MKVLILGGAGMVGQKLAQKLSEDGLNGCEISQMTLFDMVAARKPNASFQVENIVGNFVDPETSQKLATLQPDLVFHLASIVSGEAEINFTKGYDVNLRATWNLLEAFKGEQDNDAAYRPKLIFASSIAVFGGPFPEKIYDDFLCAPQTSYGAQRRLSNCWSLTIVEKDLLTVFRCEFQRFVFVQEKQTWLPLLSFRALFANP